MDSLNSDVPGALALDRLCAAAAHELLMRSYTSRTLNRYKRVWGRLTEFAHGQDCANEYSRDLVLRFEQAYGIRKGEHLKKGERWRQHLVFGIKVLDDFARTGNRMGRQQRCSGLPATAPHLDSTQFFPSVFSISARHRRPAEPPRTR